VIAVAITASVWLALKSDGRIEKALAVLGLLLVAFPAVVFTLSNPTSMLAVGLLTIATGFTLKHWS
jgi:ABC-type dipeptide/oligopeptide/nickel transport system permease component